MAPELEAVDDEEKILGRTIGGKYLVEGVVGTGSMGSVYRARQVALERTVAIKIMSSRLATQPDFVERFHREAKAASRLWHPNSVTVTDFGEEPDGLLYLVMEYVPGRTLDRLIQDEFPLAPERVVNLTTQALSAVAAAHDLGIIHRDLKPENILVVPGVDDEGRPADTVKVCDFGIAALAGDVEMVRRGDDKAPDSLRLQPPSQKRPSQKLTVVGTIVGTPAYMSPEQAQGLPPEAPSDVYSMGAVLYELLTSRPPFESEDIQALLRAQILEQPRDPRVVSPQADPATSAVCLRALVKDPRERYPNARAMRAALRRQFEGSLAPVPSSADDYATTLPPPAVTRPMPLDSSPATMRAASHVPVAPSSSQLRVSPPTLTDLRALPPPGRIDPSVPAPTLLPAVAETGNNERLRSRRGWLLVPGVLAFAAVATLLLARQTPATEASTDAAAAQSTGVAVASSRAADTTPGVIPPSAVTTTSADTPASADRAPGSRAAPRGSARALASASRGGTGGAGPTALAANHAAAAPDPEPAAVQAPQPPAPAAPEPPPAARPAAPDPAPAPAAPVVPAAVVYSPANARVVVSVSGARGTSRGAVAELVGHVSMNACYQARLRALGKAEGGAGSMHLDIDEDGVVHSVSTKLPPALAPAASCFSSQLAKHRLTRPPDTGSASADLSLELVP